MIKTRIAPGVSQEENRLCTCSVFTFKDKNWWNLGITRFIKIKTPKTRPNYVPVRGSGHDFYNKQNARAVETLRVSKFSKTWSTVFPYCRCIMLLISRVLPHVTHIQVYHGDTWNAVAVRAVVSEWAFRSQVKRGRDKLQNQLTRYMYIPNLYDTCSW